MNLTHLHRRWRRAVLCAAAALTLGGCVSKDMSDLEAYKDEILARKGGNIEPLPPIKPYERYLYQASEQGLRDPFRSFFEEEAAVEKVEKVAAVRKGCEPIKHINPFLRPPPGATFSAHPPPGLPATPSIP